MHRCVLCDCLVDSSVEACPYCGGDERRERLRRADRTPAPFRRFFLGKMTVFPMERASAIDEAIGSTRDRINDIELMLKNIMDEKTAEAIKETVAKLAAYLESMVLCLLDVEFMRFRFGAARAFASISSGSLGAEDIDFWVREERAAFARWKVELGRFKCTPAMEERLSRLENELSILIERVSVATVAKVLSGTNAAQRFEERPMEPLDDPAKIYGEIEYQLDRLNAELGL